MSTHASPKAREAMHRMTGGKCRTLRPEDRLACQFRVSAVSRRQMSDGEECRLIDVDTSFASQTCAACWIYAEAANWRAGGRFGHVTCGRLAGRAGLNAVTDVCRPELMAPRHGQFWHARPWLTNCRQ